MTEHITLEAVDGVEFGVYVARPAGRPKGGMVVIQEIYGLNPHIRSVADRYAALGYLAVAPALYDRLASGIELGYEAEDRQKGIQLRGKVADGDAELDVQAAIDFARRAGRVGVVGYCWGGTLAFRAACRLDGVSAAVAYYGGGIAAICAEAPRIPLMLHFGDEDHTISIADVERIKSARPETPVFIYSAGHGFNCDARASFDETASELARTRTLDFFSKHI